MSDHWTDCWKVAGHHSCAVKQLKAAEAKLVKTSIKLLDLLTQDIPDLQYRKNKLAEKVQTLELELVKEVTFRERSEQANRWMSEVAAREADDKLEAVRGLVEKWRYDLAFNTPPDAHDCADELEALLNRAP